MNKVGRPTDYNPEYCNKVPQYISELNSNELPMMVGFARYIGVAKSTIYKWMGEHKEFSDAVSEVMEAQELQLVNDGIYGGKEVNAPIVKLLLQSNHGMREKSDITSDGDKLEGVVIYRPEKIYDKPEE